MTEAELAEHHYKLGRILWTMGGNMRDDPTMARAHFEAASKEECDSQVSPVLCGCTVKMPCPKAHDCGGLSATARAGQTAFALSLCTVHACIPPACIQGSFT